MSMPEAHKDKKLICGQCKWLDKPYRGRTCRKRRKVGDFSRACVEFEKGNYNAEMLEIKAGPFFRKLAKKLATEDYKMDDGLELEILALQKASVSEIDHFDHRFVETNKDMTRLSKQFEKTQANRERINEISIEVTYLLNNYLYRLQRLVRAKLLTEHPEFMANYRTQDDKQAVIEALAPGLSKRIDKAEGVLDVAEAAIKNLDQNYWSLKAIKEIGEGIATRRMTDAQIMRK